MTRRTVLCVVPLIAAAPCSRPVRHDPAATALPQRSRPSRRLQQPGLSPALTW